jgi:L-cysteate sulfo-lyase
MAAVTDEEQPALGLDVSICADDVTNLDDYVGQGYGQPTAAGVEAIKLLAQTEEILLDPIYSGKGMAGLIDRIRRGQIGKDETVVFIHTGGTPALFAYNSELMSDVDA